MGWMCLWGAQWCVPGGHALPGIGFGEWIGRARPPGVLGWGMCLVRRGGRSGKAAERRPYRSGLGLLIFVPSHPGQPAFHEHNVFVGGSATLIFAMEMVVQFFKQIGVGVFDGRPADDFGFAFCKGPFACEFRCPNLILFSILISLPPDMFVFHKVRDIEN